MPDTNPFDAINFDAQTKAISDAFVSLNPKDVDAGIASIEQATTAEEKRAKAIEFAKTALTLAVGIAKKAIL